ncbi:probable serine/threonine-protein kinase yakA [Drosophila madeirensis]|uniref:Probable serine/threonine-protein kinase yakA n=1 Tax=Drosophila madeirensis TaxID=30013 RepID=A0AAU9G0M9_DROMD
MALNRRLASLGLASLALLLLPMLSTSAHAQAQGQAQTKALSRSGLPAQPADHLVPPPLPTAQRLSHAAGYSEVAPGVAPGPETPGFMTRVARWFGLGGPAARDQQLSASSNNNYAYPKPVQSFDAAGKPCSLCNKYPWVPMVGQQPKPTHPQHQHQHTPPQQQQQQSWQVQQQQQPLAQASQHRQRAVQFRGPHVTPAGQSVFLPITVPLPALSHVALPPLYNAQPFRPLENVAAPSEVRASTLPPVPAFRPAPSPRPRPRPYSPIIPSGSSSSSSNFEIVQSHQLTDFVTSVEYPATFVPSHAIDLGDSAPSSPTEQQQQQQDREQQLQQQYQLQDISTVRYELEDLSSGSVHQHLPASQLLTELGHFAETTTQQLPPADNYPAASSQQQLQQEQEQEQEQQLYYAQQYQTEETSTVVDSTTEQQPTTAAPTASPPAPVLQLNNHLAAVHHRGVYQQAGSRGRETPKRLLDSPINHALGARPFTRDPADLNFRLSQVYTPTASPPTPTPTSTYGAIDASGQYAGMSPPSPQQVIIPYTTKQRPRPFDRPWVHSQNLNDNHNHHHNHNHNPEQHDDNDVEEPHEQQESKLAAATVTAPPPPNTHRTTKYLTKILASNLRELLKRERETKRRPLGVDISRLQHNIDGWTEQEYNSLSHRPSTPTIRGRSKHIPTEYLTTTTTTPAPAPAPATGPAQQLTRQSKTTRGGGFELGGAAASPTNAGDLSTSINNLEQLHLLGERGLKRFQPLEDNRLHLDYYEAQQRPRPRPQAMTTPLPSTSSVTTTTTTGRTTTTRPTMPPSEEVVTPLYVRSTQAPTELWKQAKVAILPQTNEKVYVVTPQPRHQAYYAPEVFASASAPRPVYHQTPAPVGPRFPRVRPTPGTAGEPKAATPTISSSQLHNYTPDIFGLMGLSAYVPADPVEIIDGNSKVITIVTAAPTAAALQRPTARPTMSPSPR